MGGGGCASDRHVSRPLSTRKRLVNVLNTVQSYWQTFNSTSKKLGEGENLDPAAVLKGGGGKAPLEGVKVRPAGAKNTKGFTSKDVEQHNVPGDAWIIIKRKVYDISTFAVNHPGGEVIYTFAGRDATDVFSTFHAASTWKLLKPMYIGDLSEDELTPELLKDFREMRESMQKEQLFKSSKAYYVFKFLSNLLLLLASLAIIASSHSWSGVFSSATLLGLFWQQSGWLAHDFLHHQVFQNRVYNNAVGYFLGNLCQGFSVLWWKNKHNTHHAAPNELDDGAYAVDPDIDTLPLLAWSKEMVETLDTKGPYRALIRLQAYLFFPILLFARLSWLNSSWQYTNEKKLNAKTRAIEKGLIIAHYGWYLGAGFALLPLPMAIVWAVAAQLIAGMFLSIVFVQSHNGMEVYSDQKDFVSAQVVSTRDITGGLFNDWFTGGLNRQIEHHLFPSLPRHNLGKIARRVKDLCEKHGLVYEDVGFPTGTYRVLERLAEVAQAA